MPFAFKWVTNGRIYPDRPKDGSAYVIVVSDLAAYERACRTGDYYQGLGGPLIDNRKTTL